MREDTNKLDSPRPCPTGALNTYLRKEHQVGTSPEVLLGHATQLGQCVLEDKVLGEQNDNADADADGEHEEDARHRPYRQRLRFGERAVLEAMHTPVPLAMELVEEAVLVVL